MSDLVERLRAYRPTNEWGDGVHHMICDEAAAEIERLREALEQIAAGNFGKHESWQAKRARRALAKENASAEG